LIEGPDCGIGHNDVAGCHDIGEAISVQLSASRRDRGVQGDTYCSATLRHLSPSPPVTKMVLSFKLSTVSEPSANCLKGVCDWTKFSSERGTPNFFVNSATRVLSCFPPPFVKRMNGMLLL
jgi:hypothetical protein